MTESLYTIAALIHMLGYPAGVVALAAAGAGLLFLASRKHAFAFVLSCLLASITKVVLKFLFSIPRPDPAIIEITGYRFPSGHALVAGAFLTSICISVFALTRSMFIRILVAVVCVFLLAVVAWSRVFLHVHLPVDVIIGSVLGIGLAIGVHFVLFRRRPS